MNDKQPVTPVALGPHMPTRSENRIEGASSPSPIWWVVFTKELTELWIGGKAMILTLIYTILLGLWAYVLASNSELSLLPPKEMVFEMLKAAIAVSLFICLIIGADSISGDRERATLEGLLLTPTSRRQLVFGKYLAAISPWPACFIIIIPYWYVMSQGDEVFAQTIFWGGIMGTILALALAGIGMIVSFWSNSNRTSMFISLGLYLFLFLPTQLPGRAQTGFAGALLQQVNPLAAATHFNAKMLVNNSTWSVMWPWFVSPLALAALVVGILVVTAGSLQLESSWPTQNLVGAQQCGRLGGTCWPDGLDACSSAVDVRHGATTGGSVVGSRYRCGCQDGECGRSGSVQYDGDEQWYGNISSSDARNEHHQS